MPEVASVFEKTQLGLESVAGTGVAATKILTASQIVPGVKVTQNAFRPSGNKFNTIIVNGKEWTEASLAGPLTYTEIVYWLSNLFQEVATPATPAGTPSPTVGKQWDFNINSQSADTIKTYTIEQGSSVRAKKFVGAQLTSWGLTINRENANMTGTFIGQLMTDGITMTSLTSTAEIGLEPVLPNQVSLYLAATMAGLDAAAALDRGFEVALNLGSRVNPVWPLNRANTSYAATVELPIELTGSLTLAADAAGMALLTNLRAGSKLFLRIQAQGVALDPGTTPVVYNTVQFDTAMQVSDPGPYGDTDGVLSVTWGLTAVHDSTAGKAITARVINRLAAK